MSRIGLSTSLREGEATGQSQGHSEGQPFPTLTARLVLTSLDKQKGSRSGCH